MYPSQLLKGTYQTIILDLLSKHGKMYGYEISQLVKESSKGEVSLPEGSLYPILHKMAEEGLVTVEKIVIGRRARRYYTLTSAGVDRQNSRQMSSQDLFKPWRSCLNQTWHKGEVERVTN